MKNKMSHKKGLAAIVFKKAQKTLMDWETHDPRFTKTFLKTKKERITKDVIQCYSVIN